MKKIAQIILPVALDKEFDYSFSESQALEKGMRVMVDFRGKKTVGIVAAVTQQSKIKRLKNIIAGLDSQPLLTSQQFAFAESLSRFYPYPSGEFLFMMLPGYLRKQRQNFKVNYSRGNGKREHSSLKFIKSNDILERYERWRPLVQESLKNGSAVICLPQISYLEKIKELLERDFSLPVRILHSQQADQEFFENWQASRKNSLIIGLRKVFFYYPADLNLVIIEEEDSPYYFQEEKPFYHLRQAAYLLSETKELDLVLAGDSPSISAYKRICDKEVELIENIQESKKINLVDLGGSIQKKIIGPVLIELLNKTLNSGKTAVVLWNKKNPSRGLGIKTIVSILKSEFPEARIDSWPERSRDSRIIISTAEILSSLYAGEAFDVGFLLDTDSRLNRPDYAASFDAYLYIRKLGNFFRQPLYVFTVNPQYYLFDYLNQDWQSFYQKELDLRKKMGLPPYKVLTKLNLRSSKEKPLLKYAQDLYNSLKGDFGEIYGPMPDYPFKLRNKFRYTITIKSETTPQENPRFAENIARARRHNLKLAVELH